jgi:glycosyltransferase involved in cell wall biosynthesis
MTITDRPQDQDNLHVSVVMPSFNHGRFIRAAIDSVLSQDYQAVDLLVMDGGSRDKTVDILKSYGDRITFISQADHGQSDAINRGLSRLAGHIICWLNSDDLFMPGAVRRVVETFDENPNVDFVYGKGWTIDETGLARRDSGVLSLDVWKLIHHRNFIQQPSCFFRRSLFKRVGPIDETLFYVMDWELWIRFAAHRGLFIPDYLSSNREYEQNKTQSGQFRRWREIRQMVRKYTRSRWPPVVWLYLIEALIQKARMHRWLARLDGPLSTVFMRAMGKEMSGRYSDGSVQRSFHISVGNPDRRPVARCRFVPLSWYDQTRLRSRPVRMNWESDSGQRGSLLLLEDSCTQVFDLPLSCDRLFTHFTFTADFAGVSLDASPNLAARRIVAFLDDFQPAD